MLIAVNPKLPMRNKAATQAYYVNQLGFQKLGSVDYPDYLMVRRDTIEIHFFLFETLGSMENYSGVYIRTNDIDGIYQQLLDKGVAIHPNGPLQTKPWGQREFALLDPDNNLLTFGQNV